MHFAIGSADGQFCEADSITKIPTIATLLQSFDWRLYAEYNQVFHRLVHPTTVSYVYRPCTHVLWYLRNLQSVGINRRFAIGGATAEVVKPLLSRVKSDGIPLAWYVC